MLLNRRNLNGTNGHLLPGVPRVRHTHDMDGSKTTWHKSDIRCLTRTGGDRL